MGDATVLLTATRLIAQGFLQAFLSTNGGGTISGDIAEMAVVATDSDHAETGTVVSIICGR